MRRWTATAVALAARATRPRPPAGKKSPAEEPDDGYAPDDVEPVVADGPAAEGEPAPDAGEPVNALVSAETQGAAEPHTTDDAF
jgi:hypothetical protein